MFTFLHYHRSLHFLALEGVTSPATNTVHSRNSNSPDSGNSCISEQVMNDQFVLLLNKSYLNSGKPRNSGQFTADQTFHYIESTLYRLETKSFEFFILHLIKKI